MLRPLLNPTIFDDPDRQPLPEPPVDYRAIARLLRRLGGAIGRATLATIRFFLTPIGPTRTASNAEAAAATTDANSDRTVSVRSRFARIATGVVMRLCVSAGVMAATVAVQIEALTRPLSYDETPPLVGALYAQKIFVTTADGGDARAYLIPAIDETRVLRDGEYAAKARRPAVVLAADPRGDAHALDRLIAPLHRAGVVVLSLSPHRAGGRRTFGLHERHAVAAAVETLRARADVDASRVSVIAVGDSATSALLAARDGADVSRLILHAAPADFDAVLDAFAVHPALRPLCRWTMRLALDADVDELDNAALHRVVGGRAILLDTPPSDPANRVTIFGNVCRPGFSIETKRE